MRGHAYWRFYNHLADERGLQASTIDSVHTVLHQVLNMAVDDAYIRNNPSGNVLKELKQFHVFKTEKHKKAVLLDYYLCGAYCAIIKTNKLEFVGVMLNEMY